MSPKMGKHIEEYIKKYIALCEEYKIKLISEDEFCGLEIDNYEKGESIVICQIDWTNETE